MPVRCQFCGRTYRNAGLAIHISKAHPTASPGQQDGPRAKRPRVVAEQPPPCPQFDLEDEEDGGGHGADEDGWGDTEPEEEMDETAAQLASIRKQARDLLTKPAWRRWAVEVLEWAEDGLLSHLEDMFPEAGHFQSRETFRFLQLRSLHPGSSFAKELLAAAQEEDLDLAKVGGAPAGSIPICDL